MDKELLFRFMRTRFRDAGFTPEEIEIHISRFAEMNQAELEDAINARGSAEKMISHVIGYRNDVLMKDADYQAFVRNGGFAEESATAEQSNTTDRQEPEREVHTAEPFAELENISRGEEEQSEVQPEKTQETVDDWFSDGNREQQQKPNSVTFSHDEVHFDRQPHVTPVQRQMPQNGYTQSTVQTASVSHSGTAYRTGDFARVTPTRSEMTPRPARTSQSGDSVTDFSSTRVVPVSRENTDIMNGIPEDTAPRVGRDDVEEDIKIAVPRKQENSGVQENPQRQNVPHYRPTSSERKAKKHRSRGALSDRTYWGEASEEGYRKFRIIFALSVIPVTLLALILCAVFVLIFASLCAMVVALVVALVAWVGLGACVSLVGIIYGVSQLFMVLPIGLFETGIGVTAIGVTFFVGILIYNLAIRFLPFVIRQFTRFVKFFYNYMKDVYYYVKGECYRQ